MTTPIFDLTTVVPAGPDRLRCPSCGRPVDILLTTTGQPVPVCFRCLKRPEWREPHKHRREHRWD